MSLKSHYPSFIKVRQRSLFKTFTRQLLDLVQKPAKVSKLDTKFFVDPLGATKAHIMLVSVVLIK